MISICIEEKLLLIIQKHLQNIMIMKSLQTGRLYHMTREMRIMKNMKTMKSFCKILIKGFRVETVNRIV